MCDAEVGGGRVGRGSGVEEFGPGSLLPGTAGRCWRVEAALGAGSCCSVWRVHQEGNPDLKAALKIYKFGEVFSAAANREKLLIELVKIKKGKLPHIVDVIDKFSYDGQMCLIQTFLEASMRQMHEKNLNRPLSLAIIQQLLSHLLRGLAALHDVGFVHADLKPENLLWDPQEGALTIIDFGLSFHVKDKKIGELQSPGYRSPEVQAWNDYLFSSEENFSVDSQPQSNVPQHTSNIHQNKSQLPQDLPHLPQLPLQLQENITHLSQVPVQLSQNGAHLPQLQSPLQQNLTHLSQLPSQVPHNPSQGRVEALTDPLELSEVVKPKTSADMWSVGCIILDLVHGNKFFSSERFSSRYFRRKCQENGYLPQADMEDVVTSAFTKCCGAQTSESSAFLHLRDLCIRLLHEDPTKRPAASEALQHTFFSTTHSLSHTDMLLLPSRVLRLDNTLEDRPYGDDELSEIIEDIREECENYGSVLNIVTSSTSVLVEFALWSAAVAACEALFRKKFEGRHLTLTYFPLEDYRKQNYY